MSRIIVLSNRVKMPDNDLNKGSAGGLAVAVFTALQQYSATGGGVWLGWNGEVMTQSQNFFTHQCMQNVEYVTTAFSPKQYQHFYCGFANNVLWALLHDRADLFSAMTAEEIDTDFALYQQVNEIFALQLQHLARPDDVIWVHDYHFFGVAAACRRLKMSNRIGFFLHIPFVASEAWQACPYTNTLLHQLAQYDVIGLQTQTDKRHCEAMLQPFLASLLPHSPFINAYPIGVDVGAIMQQTRPILNHTPVLPQNLVHIVAVDRVDYSKGIIHRLQAYAQFLEAYPEYQGKVQLYQIACPSRLDVPVYHALYLAVKQAVADVQQRFATANWQPIVYSEIALGHDKLMSVFSNSQICWVNSLKDGMNLVAKEYVAAQNPDNAGVLMLSKYAGASEQMTQAVIIDPYDEQNLVDSLLQAITMPHAERQTRYQSLIQGLREQDLAIWQSAFLQDLMYTPNPDLKMRATCTP